VGNVLRELRAGGGVYGVGGSEGFEGSELLEGVDDQFWFGQNRDRVRLKAGAGSKAGFELATEDEGGEGELLFWQTELGAKEDLGRPAPGQGHEAHAFFQIASLTKKVESFLDEGLPIQRDQVGLVLVDALVVSGIERSGFFWRKSEVGKTLAGAHLSGAQDEVVWVDLADSVPIFGEVKFNGSRGVLGFESADLGLADAAEFVPALSYTVNFV
jgi:hypothetical protein